MGKKATPNLVEAARGGDRAAFERLVVELQDMAVAVCYGRLGNRELAREAAQDAFVDAFLHLAQLNEPAAFGAWFHRVLLKHCDRAVRRKRLVSEPLEQFA
jgi:DNA-directed RNA polymerase specialized sigma24 family protein